MHSRRKKIAAASLVGQHTGWFLLNLYYGEDRRNHARLKVGS